MRWPSAYYAMSSGTSRSTMRNSTHPTLPDELRTRYQSSITGFGGSASLVLSAGLPPETAALAGELAAVDVGDVAAGDGACDGVGCCGLMLAAAGFGGGGGFGAFLSVVARFRTSTFSPSFS